MVRGLYAYTCTVSYCTLCAVKHVTLQFWNGWYTFMCYTSWESTRDPTAPTLPSHCWLWCMYVQCEIDKKPWNHWLGHSCLCLSAFIGLHFLECLLYDHTRVMNWSTRCTHTDQVTCDMGFPWGGWSHSSVPRWHLSTATSTLVCTSSAWEQKWLIFIWPARPSH